MRFWAPAVWLSLALAQAPTWEVSVPKNVRIDLLPDGNLLVKSGKEGLWALSAKDGQKLWECSACNRNPADSWRQIQGYPLWEAGVLVNIPETAKVRDPDRFFPGWRFRPYMVLNAATGRLIFNLEEENQSWNWVSGRAILPEEGLLVLFGEGSKDPKKSLSITTSIIAAYDLKNGGQLWRRPAGEKPGLEGLYSNLAAYEGKVYFLTNQALYCVDARTGNTVWRTEIVKRISLRAMTGTYVFVDADRDLVVAFGRGRVIAVRRATGEPVWAKPVKVSRDNVLHAFSTDWGILLFTDDLEPGSSKRPTGLNLLYPPLAVLLRYEDGLNPWGERLVCPGLLAGYIPLDERRLFCLFQRERVFTSGQNRPEDWAVEINVLDVERGEFLFKRSISLRGALLHAQTVPGGFLVQTVRRLQYLSETGEVIWEKPVKRPFALPFAVREEGAVFQAYVVDEAGQVFLWEGPGAQPRSIGRPLAGFTSDPPQGIAWDKGKIWVWGGSTLYGLSPGGEIECEFRRPPPAHPSVIRLLGATLSVAGYIGSGFLTYKALQTLAYDPEREWDRPDLATSLKKGLTAAAYGLGAVSSAVLADAAWEALVKRRYARMKEVEDWAFFLGMKGNDVCFYQVDKAKCALLKEHPLGPMGLFRSPQYEVDPIDKRLYLLDGERLRAYSLAE